MAPPGTTQKAIQIVHQPYGSGWSASRFMVLTDLGNIYQMTLTYNQDGTVSLEWAEIYLPFPPA
jgi:hypothetical protein